MRSRITTAVVSATVILLALAGCTSTTAADPEPAPAQTSQAEEPAPASEVVLQVADSDLGEIVVDGDGMTVYMFDSDSQGGDVSTCEGQCAANWPAVGAAEGVPDVDGVTGELGTIAGVDGQPQLTLNGWPLYYFAGDAAPGDVNGQGVNGVWWVLNPAGERQAE
ncbi:hypothetical protein P0L94_02635 [Microbacter sp. GSS18]|nr:hypothetical protein P0L94_02635 [Microbacter sp. GSS18]